MRLHLLRHALIETLFSLSQLKIDHQGSVVYMLKLIRAMPRPSEMREVNRNANHIKSCAAIAYLD